MKQYEFIVSMERTVETRVTVKAKSYSKARLEARVVCLQPGIKWQISKGHERITQEDELEYEPLLITELGDGVAAPE